MGPSVGLIAMQADDEQLDDWLGTISDDDWDEGAIARAGLRRAMPADQEPADAEDDARRDAASDRAAADDHHAKVVWRRRVAALASLAVLVLAVVVGPSRRPRRRLRRPPHRPRRRPRRHPIPPPSASPRARSSRAKTPSRLRPPISR